MAYMIKDLKAMAAGTEIRGLILLIRVARRPVRDAEGNVIQEVVFLDATGEMLGNILLASNVPEPKGHHTGAAEYHVWQSKNSVCIMDAVIQDTDERKKETVKLFVTECFNAASTLSYDQSQDLTAESWKEQHENEIKGKIRHGIVCAMINSKDRPTARDSKTEEYINAWVDFIMTGE